MKNSKDFKNAAMRAFENEKKAARYPKPLFICHPSMVPVYEELLGLRRPAPSKGAKKKGAVK